MALLHVPVYTKLHNWVLLKKGRQTHNTIFSAANNFHPGCLLASLSNTFSYTFLRTSLGTGRIIRVISFQIMSVMQNWGKILGWLFSSETHRVQGPWTCHQNAQCTVLLSSWKCNKWVFDTYSSFIFAAVCSCWAFPLCFCYNNVA